MLYHYERILDRCEPYLIATDLIADHLNASPLGVTVPARNRVNPQHRRHGAFLDQLRLVDSLTFGPYGMAMPQWVFYDCAVMPGAVFGFGARAETMEQWILDALHVPSHYEGLIPLSMFIAIPMVAGHAEPWQGHETPPPTWLLYTLESMNQVSPGMGPAGLLLLTIALGLRVFPIRTLYGATQWRGAKLATYVDLGPLDVVTAYTPAHSLPRTMCFRAEIREESLQSLLMGPRVHPMSPPANYLLDVDDLDALKSVQRELETGRRYQIVAAPSVHGAWVQVPMRRFDSEGA